jgi:hypothetical protein
MSTETAAAQRTEEGSILELMHYVLPRLRDDARCPTWPPDAFAVVATVMRRTGAYVHCVSTVGGRMAVAPSLESKWPRRARTVGAQWLQAVEKAIKDAPLIPKQQAIARAVVPAEVAASWDALMQLLRASPAADGREIARRLLEISGFADEACAGLGMPDPQDTTGFHLASDTLLTLNRNVSFCSEVSATKARVLPKKHTPQQGLTLRSLTHHLALCMPWEVSAQWRTFGRPRLTDVINLLLLPWPLQVDAKHFSLVEHPANYETTQEVHRTFSYHREPESEEAFRRKLLDAIERSRKQVSELHAVIFPELALSCSEWEVANRVAREQRLLLVAGIFDDRDRSTGLPVNACRVQVGTLADPIAEKSEVSAEELPALSQSKHHRWCLDRNQVLQYDLGGQLPTGLRCWENSHVDRREIFFATLGGWMTFSVLICEDLARQDPIADVMRAVGPNLVVALLMDGPQLTARWPARYASVLADDPGTSVLSLTSLGMCVRSRRPDDPKAPPSRVVGLWKDKLYGSRELSLGEGKEGCVLSLACERREEYTADGRSDEGYTQVPVYSGLLDI